MASTVEQRALRRRRCPTLRRAGASAPSARVSASPCASASSRKARTRSITRPPGCSATPSTSTSSSCGKVRATCTSRRCSTSPASSCTRPAARARCRAHGFQGPAPRGARRAAQPLQLGDDRFVVVEECRNAVRSLAPARRARCRCSVAARPTARIPAPPPPAAPPTTPARPPAAGTCRSRSCAPAAAPPGGACALSALAVSLQDRAGGRLFPRGRDDLRLRLSGVRRGRPAACTAATGRTAGRPSRTSASSGRRRTGGCIRAVCSARAAGGRAGVIVATVQVTGGWPSSRAIRPPRRPSETASPGTPLEVR